MDTVPGDLKNDSYFDVTLAPNENRGHHNLQLNDSAECERGNLGTVTSRRFRSFTLSYGEQEKTIRLYPIHKQLRLYMYGMTQNRPIEYHLLGPVASTGTEIIPSTLAMLELVDSDEELSAVLALLLQIDQDYYHWRIDKDLIDLARQKTSLVRKQEWQQRVLDILGQERK